MTMSDHYLRSSVNIKMWKCVISNAFKNQCQLEAYQFQNENYISNMDMINSKLTWNHNTSAQKC